MKKEGKRSHEPRWYQITFSIDTHENTDIKFIIIDKKTRNHKYFMEFKAHKLSKGSIDSKKYSWIIREFNC